MGTRIGIMMILLSLCALLVSLPFISKYNDKRSLLWNMGKMEIILDEKSVDWTPSTENVISTRQEKIGDEVYTIEEIDYDPFVNYVIYSKQYIPFKWFFAGDMIVLFCGIGLVLICRHSEK